MPAPPLESEPAMVNTGQSIVLVIEETRASVEPDLANRWFARRQIRSVLRSKNRSQRPSGWTSAPRGAVSHSVTHRVRPTQLDREFGNIMFHDGKGISLTPAKGKAKEETHWESGWWELLDQSQR